MTPDQLDAVAAELSTLADVLDRRAATLEANPEGAAECRHVAGVLRKKAELDALAATALRDPSLMAVVRQEAARRGL